MIPLNFPQGSIEWISARLWRLTSSELKANITPKGKLSRSEKSLNAVDKLIAGIDLARELEAMDKRGDLLDLDEWKLNKFMGNYVGKVFQGNSHTDRGNELEPDAMAALSEVVGEQFQEIGMCVIGDQLDKKGNPSGVVSCSPDGYLSSGGKFKAGGEAKCPCLSTWYGYIHENVLPSDYELQVHSSMAICESDIWHFGAYFKGKPLFYKKVERNSFTDTLAKSFEEFQTLYSDRFFEVKEKEKALLDRGEKNLLDMEDLLL